MPELPEVETIVRGLQKRVLNRTFIGLWTDTRKLIKKPKNFTKFKKELIGSKIKNIKRRGKNILFQLTNNKTLLVHQKLTGHLLRGTWNPAPELASLVQYGAGIKPRKVASLPRGRHGTWISKSPGPLRERVNSYIHLLFLLDDGKMIALSDLRKFAKVELWDNKELEESLQSFGPEPLDGNFTFNIFKKRLKNKKGRIKQVLIDQAVIAGIGNIYSDEILFEAGVHPFRSASSLKEKELKIIYQALKKILRKAVKLGGTSISDFRDVEGRSGFFGKQRKVYQRKGEKCKKCGTIIKRVKIGGRSAHFCPKCQK